MIKKDDKLVQNKKKKSPTNKGVGIALGIALGTAMGITMDNLALGIGIGIAIGAAFEFSNSKVK